MKDDDQGQTPRAGDNAEPKPTAPANPVSGAERLRRVVSTAADLVTLTAGAPLVADGVRFILERMSGLFSFAVSQSAAAVNPALARELAQIPELAVDLADDLMGRANSFPLSGPELETLAEVVLAACEPGRDGIPVVRNQKVRAAVRAWFAERNVGPAAPGVPGGTRF